MFLHTVWNMHETNPSAVGKSHTVPKRSYAQFRILCTVDTTLTSVQCINFKYVWIRMYEYTYLTVHISHPLMGTVISPLQDPYTSLFQYQAEELHHWYGNTSFNSATLSTVILSRHAWPDLSLSFCKDLWAAAVLRASASVTWRLPSVSSGTTRRQGRTIFMPCRPSKTQVLMTVPLALLCGTNLLHCWLLAVSVTMHTLQGAVTSTTFIHIKLIDLSCSFQ